MGTTPVVVTTGNNKRLRYSETDLKKLTQDKLGRTACLAEHLRPCSQQHLVLIIRTDLGTIEILFIQFWHHSNS